MFLLKSMPVLLAASLWAGSPVSAGEASKDVAAVAAVILDPKKPDADREAAIKAHPDLAAELIAHVTRGLPVGTPAEYERIPWIWRVAVAAGRRNDAAQMKRVLAVSVPQDGQPLRDWQAVVIGGGIINGISDTGAWPAARVAEVLRDDPTLQKRYQRALDLASAMTDDEKVPAPTRYDALRMLGAEPWEKRGDQLVRYLAKGTHEELQMGAVSGIADVDSPHATASLLNALPDLAGQNRDLALNALLRDDARATALLNAVEAGKVERAALGGARAEKLKNYPNESLRRRAVKLITAP